MYYVPARMYLLAACVMNAVWAAVIVPHHASLKPAIHVSVKQKYYYLHHGDSLKIRCRAKGGHEIDDIPIITFYRKLKDGKTIMPLSSSSYGVSILASGDKSTRRSRLEERRAKSYIFKHGRGVLRTTKILHLHKEIYYILDYGINRFYCRATTIGGQITEQSFNIIKL